MTETKITSLKERVNTVRALLLTNRAQIEMALPRHMNADRMLRIAMTSISTTPKLLDCTPRSLLGAVIQCAQLGLEPGILGHAYLIPFENRKAGTVEVQLIVGYKGLIQLARRSGEISTITAHEVRERDKFSYRYGLAPLLEHVPHDDDRGEITHFYAVMRLKDGGAQFEVMTKAEVDAHRDRYSRAAKQGPWVTDYVEMGKKTTLRKVSKLGPASVELQRAIALDEHAEAQIPQHLGDVIDFPEEPKASALDQLADQAKGETTPATA